MKKVLTLLGLSFLLLSFTVNGDPKEVIDALNSGNASELVTFLDDFIDLSLPNKDDKTNMGKNQASLAIKSYYEEMAIQSFMLTSKREAGAIMYITGKLQGKTKNEGITIILKNAGSKYKITSIRIGS